MERHIKMIRFCCLTAWVLVCHFSRGQSYNLVPNASFDYATSCPRTEGEVDLAIPWLNTLRTPDLFLVCAENDNFKVPHPRKCTYLQPHSGEGYAGLTTFGNTREIIGVPLKQPLEKGKSYFLQFWVAIDDVCSTWDRGTFTDAIGMGFGEDNYDIPDFPALEHRGTILYDTIGWTAVYGCYIAHGNEKYLFILNFRENDQTLAVSSDPAVIPVFDYMYIDDVAVIPMNPYPDSLPYCGDPIRLAAFIPEANYRWDNQSTDSIRWINGGGTYTVQVTLGQCSALQTIYVADVLSAIPADPSLVICDGTQTRLQPSIPGITQWDNGQNAPTRTIDQAGQYLAQISNECGDFEQHFDVTAQDCGCRVSAPNVFSPNEDLINDLWRPYLQCPTLDRVLQLQIYNRQGQLIFTSSDLEQRPWDGRFNNVLAPTGVYVWTLSYRTNKAGVVRTEYASGDLTIVR
ncbi:MAG: gliding motility-associated C-terminal domain-containing protein [Saprospiraceae bacterium]